MPQWVATPVPDAARGVMAWSACGQGVRILRQRSLRLALPVVVLVLWLGGAAHAQTAPTSATLSPPDPVEGAGSTVSPTDGSTPPIPPAEAARLDTALLHSVLMTAMEFLAPRTLQPHTAHQFSNWGLGGISALDPSLRVVEGLTGIQLMAGQTAVLTRPVPSADDARGWADVSTALLAAAWDHSDTIRTAGQTGLMQSFFDELFNHLDPYSRYVGPAPAETDREARSGGDADIGLSLGEEFASPSSGRRARGQGGKVLVVTAVNANGPAWPAGVDVGDRLLAVNGRSVGGLASADVEALLRGATGSQVVLRISSGNGRKLRTVSVRRAQVPPETVFAFASGPLVVLRITSFSSETAEEMSQYLDQAAQDPRFRGLILDLRGNRGGVLQQAVTAAALLLDRGVAVVTKGRDPQANHVWAVQGGDMTQGLPVAILVDGRTASAAEILAAALSDHRRAVVIGSATLGKGLVQTVAQMPDGGELFVTWSRVIAPLGWPLQGLGVMPQICTSRGNANAQRQMTDLLAGRTPDSSTVLKSRSVRYPVAVSSILDIRKSCPAALGGDVDLELARTLLESRKAYMAALSMIPDDGVPGAVAQNE